MIGLLGRFRLIPVVLLATGALFTLKTFGLILDGGYIFEKPSPSEADGRPSGSNPNPDDIVGSIGAAVPPPPQPPPVTAPVIPATLPPAPLRQSWAQEMFNFPDVTGSVGATKPAEKKDGPAEGKAKPEAKPGIKTAAATPADKPVNVMEQRLMSPAERAILERLGDRRKDLEVRARELDMRETLIKAAEKRLEDKVSELKQVEARIKTTESKKDEAESARFKDLIAMYENMKPKDAARIFDRLDIKVLVDVASHMKPRQMSEILGQMSSEAAERLTVEFATRAATPRSPAAADLPKIEGQPTAAGNPPAK
jgi:flagellar motility protein MotE (MotC chaperone)